MEIISHRGYWKSNNEKNTKLAFNRSFNLGFGTETDIRDYNGNLVISHDIPDSKSISFNDFLKYNSNKKLILALNIKSDGLQIKISKALLKYNITNYFVFDMSFPDTIGYLNKSLNVFIRVSEYEDPVFFHENIKGIWLDSFNDIWYDKQLIFKYLKRGLKIAIVSNELHKRDKFKLWNKIKEWGFDKQDNIILCTDYPEEATFFFK